MSKPEKAISDLIAKRPSSAVRLNISKLSLKGNQIVCSFTPEEIESESIGAVLKDILDQCDQWAESESRETTFVGDWIAGDEHIGRSLQWRVLPPGAVEGPSDGSIESILSNLQKMLKENHQYTVDLTKLVGGIMEQTVKALMERIGELETERSSTLALKEELLIEAATLDEGTKENMTQLMELAKTIINAKLKAPQD